jgi:hypothetical protein
MTRVTERVLELEARLAGPVSRAEPKGGQFDFEKFGEPARTAQPTPREDQWAPQETVPAPMPLRTAQPERISQKPPRPRVARRRLNRSVVLALVVVMVIALGMVAFALVTLEKPPSTSQNTTTCTMAAGGAGCNVGGGLYVTKLDVAATPYNGSYVIIIVLTVKNNGTNPITMSSIQFDSTALQNGPPAHGGIGNGIWSSSANPIANNAISQLIMNVPATSASALNGTHTITLVDSSGTSYKFSVTISLH